MNHYNKSVSWRGYQSSVSRVIGTWSGLRIGREDYPGLLVNLYIPSLDRYERHVRVICVGNSLVAVPASEEVARHVLVEVVEQRKARVA